MAVSIDLRQLRLLLEDRVNDSELRTLCFDLQVPYENLSGDNKADKLRGFISYLNSRSRLDDLLHILRQDRPDLQPLLQELMASPPPVSTKKETVETESDGSQYGRSLEQLSQSLKRNRLLLFLGSDLPKDITGLPDRQTIADALARSEGLEPG
ncbi:MAG: hypothetical protein P8183_19150, partial [Anaerolineae bacterium]